MNSPICEYKKHNLIHLFLTYALLPYSYKSFSYLCLVHEQSAGNGQFGQHQNEQQYEELNQTKEMLCFIKRA